MIRDCCNVQILKTHNNNSGVANTLAKDKSWKILTPHKRKEFSNMIFNVLVINITLHKMKDKIFIEYSLLYIEKKIIKKLV